MPFRDDAEAQVDRWRDTFFHEEPTALVAGLAEALAVMASGGEGPTLVLDVGEVLEIADVFCVKGLRRDAVGAQCLAAARACYREVAKWPSPLPAIATRSRIARELAQSSPRRLHPASLAKEVAALERAQAAAGAERPWLLAELHWAKLRAQWAREIHDGDLPGVHVATCLTVRCGETLPELGALLATVIHGLRVDFVEASGFTDGDRDGVAREFLDTVRSGARRHAAYLREEVARLPPADPRAGAARAALTLLDG